MRGARASYSWHKWRRPPNLAGAGSSPWIQLVLMWLNYYVKVLLRSKLDQMLHARDVVHVDVLRSFGVDAGPAGRQAEMQ